MYSRLAALPEKAAPACSTLLLSAMRVGSEVVRLRTLAPDLPIGQGLKAALANLAKGHNKAAIAEFDALDRELARVPVTAPSGQEALEARARILGIVETVSQHSDYFDAGGEA
jgi:hypothetical protein